MNSFVLKAGDSSKWHEILRNLGKDDVFFYPEYHRAFEINGNGEAHAFVVEDGDSLFFYPFMLNPVPQRSGSAESGWFDIETVFGNAGPILLHPNPDFVEKSWACFDSWCREQRVVAEFIRFSPILSNHTDTGQFRTVVKAKDTVAVPLNVSEQDLWNGYAPRQRRFVRQAIEHGLRCQAMNPIDGLQVFLPLYYRTMDRVKAEQHWYFSEAHFRSLVQGLPEALKIFAVWDRETVIGAAIFFVTEEVIHYHLAGNDENFSRLRPSNFLIHTVADWGRTQEKKWLLLGGGVTSKPEDTLFQFKTGFSQNLKPFFIGWKIHNENAYEHLCREWMSLHNLKERPAHVLLYRLKHPPT